MTRVRSIVLALVCVLFAACPTGLGPADPDQGEGVPNTGGDSRTYAFWIGYEKEEYPQDGTIFGDWLEAETGVRVRFEFLVGDLHERVNLIAASGDYPDAIHPRNETQILMDANALIPLNDLIDEHGPNIRDLYGERGLAQIARDDGEVYWFPQQMPYGDVYRNPHAGHGVYVQAAVLQAWDYQIPEDLDTMTDWLIDYAEDNPTINEHPTIAWTGQYDSWRWFGVSNIPHVLTGHPNDGVVNVDRDGDRWVASEYRASQDEYDAMRQLNKVHLEGFYDTESFGLTHEEYIANLRRGNVLAFYDQDWNFADAQEHLLEQNQGRWYVAIPVMIEEGYEPTILNPPTPQVSEGIGISVDAEDPEGIMQYFNVLAGRDALLLRTWGREGTDYNVGAGGVFSRTGEQIERWRDPSWRDRTYGAQYWDTFLRIDGGSVIWDGLNNADPNYQPGVFRNSLLPQERAVLNQLGVTTWSELFPAPDMDRTEYFPAWSIAIPGESSLEHTAEQIDGIRRTYLESLITAPEGGFDNVWAAYITEMDAVPQADRDARLQFYQDAIDERVANARRSLDE